MQTGDPTHHEPPRLTERTSWHLDRFGSSHSACACTKPIPCLVVFAALFSGSNSNSTTPWYRNYTGCLKLTIRLQRSSPTSGAPGALIQEFQMVPRTGREVLGTHRVDRSSGSTSRSLSAYSAPSRVGLRGEQLVDPLVGDAENGGGVAHADPFKA
jgi:hypothetical protein